MPESRTPEEIRRDDGNWNEASKTKLKEEVSDDNSVINPITEITDSVNVSVKDVNHIEFLEKFNLATERKFKILDDKTKRQINARLKEGFTIEDILTATLNCKKDKYHIENPQYLTPEFITRADKLQKFLNIQSSNNQNQKSWIRNELK